MKVLKEGAQPPTTWHKVVTCTSLYSDGRACEAIFEIGVADCVRESFGNQDDRSYEYTYHTVCPNCGARIRIPELDYSPRGR